ncbi:bacteriocin immunity protein [Vibrio parahaemolyticus]|nr:bacteriocin immunity protein [Vibrio parahaemolyticus]MBE4106948.1 bacteriocin immunity protein [Vibrio parahaemolyticus]TOF56301.1 bacteriocin immunity protein [Vibrio parahaemolyticus]TOL39275.1 bacteriocin immunity protein [Vibrio parahaemolyticus]TOL73736.1 bacteriocin immunity protein [Vibrio parahaemolyticus]TOO55922.1 bacteriocin immunity protein [Vibrio parahaemolyticus]
MKNCLLNYTESEFLKLILDIHTGTASDQDVERLVSFLDTTDHPEGSALLTHPKMIGIEDTPEAMVAELKRWYTEKGQPCFKDQQM